VKRPALGLGLGALLLSVLGGGGSADAQAPEILAVTAWKLDFTYDVDSHLASKEQSFDYTVEVTGSGVLAQLPDDSLRFEGAPKINVKLDYHGSAIDSSGCGLTESLAGVGAPICRLDPALELFDEEFGLALNCDRVPVKHTFEWVGTGCQFDYPEEPITDWLWQADAVATGGAVRRDYSYPASGVELSGDDSNTLDGMLAPLFTALASGTLTPLDYDFSFTLTPSTEELVKLVIEPKKYDDWRPSSTKQGDAGEALSVTARLVTASGGKPAAKIKKLSWRLEKTSQEHGVSMNFPPNAVDDDFDLRFEPAKDLAHVTYEDGQTLDWIDPQDARADTVQILPYDWGGWSTLKVTAELDDGRPIEGKLEGETADGARLPKRAEDSLIADVWKRKMNVDAADDADDEDLPRGDGNIGDGLVLYQEYRGFYENDEHIGGEPTQKDFFIRNVAAGVATAGIIRFENRSGLLVHSLLKQEEFPTSRVINANRRAAPKATLQHGVIIEVGVAQPGVSRAVGGPGNPGKVEAVRIMEDWFTLDANTLASTVAHELMHCVNVYHHGDDDHDVVWRDVDGFVVETGGPRASVPISVTTEAGEDITWLVLGRVDGFPDKLTTLVLGVDGGQSSGPQDCMMRYNNAHAYVDRENPGNRYVFPGELLGRQLCSSGIGTGVNDADRAPMSRFSDATRGDCSAQILVTDRVVAPMR
jgi:hypothetical protein